MTVSVVDEDEEGEEDLVTNKAPKKIRRSHLQKRRGRATHEQVNLKPKPKQSIKSGVATAGKSSGGKKALLQGLLVLRPAKTAMEEEELMPPLVVGRSSKQNERVTFELGKDHHLWFHVQGFPGSHCLLQLQPGEAATPAAIQYAADVAAFYSQARGSTTVPVGFSSPRYIKRISGGSPGSVSVLRQEGLVYGSPERGRELSERLTSL
jgi:hypothetical protein